MKITKSKLQEIIREELEKVVKEYGAPVFSTKKEKSQYAPRMPVPDEDLEDDRTELEKAVSKDKKLKEKEEKTVTSPTGREETPCKGRGCVTKQRKEIEKYAQRIDKKMKSGKINKTYVDKKTGKRKETNKYALATAAAKDPGSMRGSDFARKIPKDVNPKTGAKKKKK